MVGLPARGKTYIARKLCRYLSFFHGAPAEVINIGNYRRQLSGAEQSHSFFDYSNATAMKARMQAAQLAMTDLKKFCAGNEVKGKVAVFDGSNLQNSRRAWILEELLPLMDSKSHIVFVESISTDPSVIEANLRALSESPDYAGKSEEDFRQDFKKRIEHYEKVYETVDDESLSWIKLVNGGRQVTANRIRGFLQTRVLQFLMSINTSSRPIYLSRHGQSEYNKLGKVGGDSDLSEMGELYAKKLAKFMETQVLNQVDADRTCNYKHTRLWTSSLKRTIRTARHCSHAVQPCGWVTMRPRVDRNLDELYAGIFDGMTYEEIEAAAPEEFAKRQKNKLSYRYPRGESYLDVISRLDNLIHELETQRDPVLIVGHQGVLRIVYAYLMGIPREKAPFVSMPLNTVVKLVPQTYSCSEERLCLVHKDAGNAPSH